MSYRDEIKNSPEYKEVVSKGGDPEAILDAKSERWKRYSDKTAGNFAAAELARWLTNQDLDSVTGLVVGGYDRYGSKAPITFICLQKDGTGAKICTWENDTFRVPSVVTVAGRRNEQYNNLLVSEVRSQVAAENVRDKLARIAWKPTSPNWKNAGKYDVVVVRGIVQWVNPETKWVNNEKDGEWNLLEFNEDKEPAKHPVLSLSLKSEGTPNRIAIQFGRQRHGKPVIEIEDFIPIIQDAIAEFPDNVTSASAFVKDGIAGREIVAVGEIVGITEKVSQEGNPILYVNVNAVYASELPFEFPDQPKSTLDVGDTEPACVENNKREREEKARKEAESFGKQEEKPEEKQEEKSDAKSSGGKAKAPSTKTREMSANILALAKTLGKNPAMMSEKELREALKLPNLTPDSTIRTARGLAADDYAKSEESV